VLGTALVPRSSVFVSGDAVRFIPPDEAALAAQFAEGLRGIQAPRARWL
jgi:hypothetical protein